MPDQLDDMMERASHALARMDYLTTEALCLEALAVARAGRDWSYYARILLPLQEARRQRRIIAAEGTIRLGTADLQSAPATWTEQIQTGCIVLTRPHTAADARALHEQARAARLHLEVLFADSEAAADRWTLASYLGPAVRCAFAAPPRAWREQWLPAGVVPASDGQPPLPSAPATPADWFLDACEALGDAAIEALGTGDAPAASGEAGIEALEPALEVAPDHEILHQRLAAAARAAARETGKGRG